MHKSELQETNFKIKIKTQKNYQNMGYKRSDYKANIAIINQDGKEWEWVNTKKMAFNQKENQRIKIR